MNRAPVLLSGGTAQDRAAWAQEAAEIGGRPLVTVTRAEQLGSALQVRSAVLFVPDVATLGDPAQQQLVRTLTSIDERPKLVLGLTRSESSARQAGLLREDLHYRVRMGLLNLDAPGLRDAIAARRAEAARRAALPPPRLTPARVPGPAATAARAAPARPKAKARPAQRSRAVPRVKSARTAKVKPSKKAPAKKSRPARKASKRR